MSQFIYNIYIYIFFGLTILVLFCSLSVISPTAALRDGLSRVRVSAPRRPALNSRVILYSKPNQSDALHRGDLDELLEQRGSLHQVLAEAHLGRHPVLHLVEAPHEALQVGRGGAGELAAAEDVVDELHLKTCVDVCEARGKTARRDFYLVRYWN